MCAPSLSTCARDTTASTSRSPESGIWRNGSGSGERASPPTTLPAVVQFQGQLPEMTPPCTSRGTPLLSSTALRAALLDRPAPSPPHPTPPFIPARADAEPGEPISNEEIDGVPLRFLSDVSTGRASFPKRGILELDYVVMWPRDGVPVEPQVGGATSIEASRHG